jgi:seryl-tRNA synthetase
VVLTPFRHARTAHLRADRMTVDDCRSELNRCQDKMKVFYKEKKPVPPELTAEKNACDAKIAEMSVVEQSLIDERDKALGMIGNLVHESVHVSDNEDHNPVVRTNGEFTTEPWMLSHIDLIHVRAKRVPGSAPRAAQARFRWSFEAPA